MSSHEQELRKQVQKAWRREAPVRVPSFKEVWQRAETQLAATRRRYMNVAAAAVVLAVIAIAFGVRAPVEAPTYVEVADLLESTYWSAPSDVLVPHREFDLYQDLPALFEST